MSKIDCQEDKFIVYYEVRQPFTEVNYTDNTTTENGFMLKEKTERVIHHNNITIVILDDGSEGMAKCDSSHKFDKTTGIKIAYYKAKIKSMQRSLEKIISEINPLF